MRKKLRQVFGLFIACSILSLSACAWWINHTEELHYGIASMYLQEIVETKNIDADCDYNFDLEKPEMFPVTYINDDGRVGEYNTKEKTIKYLFGSEEAIYHEAFHHISRNGNSGPQTYYCLEQTSAALLSALIKEINMCNKK